MAFWPVGSIEEEPQVLLSEWQVVQTPDGGRHFVGYNMRLREGRVSSAIVRFDPSTRTGVTESGRVYRLEGEPGEGETTHPDALAAWTGWCQSYGIKSASVITDEVLRSPPASPPH